MNCAIIILIAVSQNMHFCLDTHTHTEVWGLNICACCLSRCWKQHSMMTVLPYTSDNSILLSSTVFSLVLNSAI